MKPLTRNQELRLQQLDIEAEACVRRMAEIAREKAEIEATALKDEYPLTAGDLLRSTGWSRKKLERYCDRDYHRLPFITVAMKRRFNPKQVADWMERLTD